MCAPEPAAGTWRLRALVRRYGASWSAVLGACGLLAIALLALLAPWIAPQNPYDLATLDLLDARLAPGSGAQAGGFIYWLGTDGQGRDMLSAILYGLRISLGVALLSSALAFGLGTALGILAGYRGGLVDSLIMRWADLQLAFPSILIALILLAFLRPGIGNVVIALVSVQWAYYARTARAAAVAERGKEYIEAARGLALSPGRIMLRHVLPNCAAPLIVVAALQVASAITLEATLSFLGLGVPVTQPSLGLLIANGFAYLLSGTYWISVFPGLALVATIAAINLVADQLHELLNPRLRID